MSTRVMSTLPRTKCNGKGTIFHKGFSFVEDDGTVKTYPNRDSECYACHGGKEFEVVDAAVLDRLLALLTTTRGAKQRGTLIDHEAYDRWLEKRVDEMVDESERRA